VHSKLVLGPLHKAGVAPSVPTVTRAIKEAEVPISYGYEATRLDTALTSSKGTIHATMVASGIRDGSVLLVVAEDETAMSGSDMCEALFARCGGWMGK
jgi:hypothetical protein